MISLTPQQAALLRFIRGYQLANGGISPSYGDCGRGMGISSKSSIHRLLTGLEERGAIRRLRDRQRAIKVLRPTAIPMVGSSPLYAVPMVAHAGRAFSGERV